VRKEIRKGRREEGGSLKKRVLKRGFARERMTAKKGKEEHM